MNGFKVYRLKKHYSRKELATMVDVPECQILLCEKDALKINLKVAIRMAKVLDVTVDELLSNYDEEELSISDRVTRRQGHVAQHPANSIGVYRRAENLSYQQLADILGIGSRQGAQKVCRSRKPSRKHIETLTAREGLTLAEFCLRYAPEGREAA